MASYLSVTHLFKVLDVLNRNSSSQKKVTKICDVARVNPEYGHVVQKNVEYRNRDDQNCSHNCIGERLGIIPIQEYCKKDGCNNNGEAIQVVLANNSKTARIRIVRFYF